jgi:hypothetical protein
LIALLLALLVRPPSGVAGTGTIVEIGPESDFSATSSDVARDVTLVRRSTLPPTTAELDRIALSVGTLFAVLPSAMAILDVTGPERPRAERAAQIAWRLHAQPGQAGTVRLADATGTLDSAVIAIGEDGSATGAFRVQPARPGWQEWTVAWDTITARTGAWVLPSQPLRALVVSPAGSVEGRDVARALEAGGAEVTLAQPLGRGLALGDAPTELPTDVEDLRRYSVVLVLSTELTPTQVSALRIFAESGGGVLAAGRSAASLPFVRAVDPPAQQASADDIAWATPPEIPALPPADVTVTIAPIAVASPAVTVAASTPSTPLLALAQAGRGRMAALAVEDTWVWGLQAGRGPDLNAFWRGMAEWLDGGTRSAFVITVEPERAAPGALVEVRLSRVDEATPVLAALELVRPDGSRASLALGWDGGVGHASFVTSGEGVFAVQPPATLSEPVATHISEAVAPPPSDAWARLALLVAQNGGELLPEPELERRIDELRSPLSFRIPPIAWLALALMLALAEWTARRLRGMP